MASTRLRRPGFRTRSVVFVFALAIALSMAVAWQLIAGYWAGGAVLALFGIPVLGGGLAMRRQLSRGASERRLLVRVVRAAVVLALPMAGFAAFSWYLAAGWAGALTSAAVLLLAVVIGGDLILRRAYKTESRFGPFSLFTRLPTSLSTRGSDKPKSPVRQLQLAARAGFMSVALSDLDAFARSAENRPRHRVEARFAAARRLLESGRVGEAEEQVRFALEIEPNCFLNPARAQTWAQVLISTGRFAEARQFIAHDYPKPELADQAWRLSWVNAHPEPEHDAVRLETLSELFTLRGFAGLEPAFPDEPLALEHLQATDVTASAGGPLVSVVMPVFNAEGTIGFSIESLCSQSHTNLEILVVDDASTDGTVAVAATIAARDPRVKILAQETNGGTFVSRNIGLKHATGAYITVHDADDWSHPQMIEVQLAALVSSSNVVATVTNLVRVGPRLEGVRRPGRNTSSLLMARDTFEQVGPWDEVLFAADGEFVERIVASFGEASLRTVEPEVPFTLALASESSLTAASFAGVTYLHHVMGARHIYRDSYRYWHEESRARGIIRLDLANGRPFYAPAMMTSRERSPVDVDVVIMADLSRPLRREDLAAGGIATAATDGLKIALLHHPAYPDHTLDPVTREVLAIVDGEHIRFAVAGDRVDCDLLVVAVDQDWGALVDIMPEIHADRAIVVDATSDAESTLWSDNGDDLVSRLEVALGVALRRENGPVWPLVARRTHQATESTTRPVSSD